jgi:phosphoenolpyruvate synthase/pyruvate phosphate dikinase
MNRNKIIRMHLEGFNDKEISAALGLSVSYVSVITADYWHNMMQQKKLDQWLKDNSPGLNVSYACSLFRLSASVIRARIFKLGLDPDIINEIIKHKNDEKK